MATVTTTNNLRVTAFAIFIVALGLVSLLQKPKDWEHVYLPAAIHLRAGENILRDGYVYPPFQALLAAPFSCLSPPMARVLWALTNAAASALLFASAWRLSGGGTSFERREYWILALGLAAALGFVFDVITNGQTDIILAAFVIGGCLASTRGYPLGGAALIGLGAAAKCTPLLFAPYLVLKRRWSSAGVLVAVAFIANLLPDLIAPASDGHSHLLEWGQNYPGAVLAKTYVPGTWATAVEFNHSLAGMLNRLLPRDYLRVAWAIGAITLLTIAIAAIHRARATPAAEMNRFEIGMVLTLMLLLSPVSSKPHFCILLLPAWTLAREMLTRNDRFLGAVVFLSAVCGLASNKDLVGRALYDALKWHGAITLQALLLFAGCAWAQRNLRQAKS